VADGERAATAEPAGLFLVHRHFAARRAHGLPPPGLRHLPPAAQGPCFTTERLMAVMSGMIIGEALTVRANVLSYSASADCAAVCSGQPCARRRHALSRHVPEGRARSLHPV
jgi:hypothetical protein